VLPGSSRFFLVPPGSSSFADQEIGPDAPLDTFDGRRVARIS